MDLSKSKINLAEFRKTNEAKFQLLGKEIMKFTNEKKFPLILFLHFPFYKVEKAFLIAEKKQIRSSKYIFGIAKKLK